MASHFRSAERQGSEDESQSLSAVPEAAPQAEALTADDTGAFLAAADSLTASAPVAEDARGGPRRHRHGDGGRTVRRPPGL